jgi:hypothetical protein
MLTLQSFRFAALPTVALAVLSGLLTCSLPQDVAAATASGFARNRTDPLYPGVNDGVPLLETFYFRFHQGGGSVDHHLNAIMVLPSGAARDVSPGAGIPKPVVARGRIALMYRDKDGKDQYFYRVAHDSAPLPGVRRYSIRDVGCAGTCERLLPPPPVPGSVFVLVGFELFFTGGRDHHVDEIAVYETNRRLTVKLNDKNDDDVFGYVVDYAWVSPASVRSTGVQSGAARGATFTSVPLGRKVIRGFHFDYSSSDHHLREIGVLFRGARLEVYYGDKNADDRFTWNVRWAIVGPSLFPRPPIAPPGKLAPR